MADRFIEQSKEIANNFIQNIVFIDDKAYKNDMTNNAFSALDVSNVFAQSGKICAVYAPKSISDVNSYNTILNKADVVILAYIIHSGFISGYQNRYGDNLKPPTNVYHRMTA